MVNDWLNINIVTTQWQWTQDRQRGCGWLQGGHAHAGGPGGKSFGNVI